MNTTGWTASDFCARARNRTLIIAFSLAAAVPLWALPVLAASKAAEIPANRPLGALLQVIKTGKPAQLPRAHDELLAMGESAVVPLLRIMNPKIPKRDARVIAVLNKMGMKAPPLLIDLLDDKKLGERAARALVGVGRHAGDQARRLLDCVEHNKVRRHMCGGALIRAMGPDQHRWVGRFAETMKARHAGLRYYSARSLHRIGIHTPGVRDALLPAINDRNHDVRKAVRDALTPPVVKKPKPKKPQPKKPQPKKKRRARKAGRKPA